MKEKTNILEELLKRKARKARSNNIKTSKSNLQPLSTSNKEIVKVLSVGKFN